MVEVPATGKCVTGARRNSFHQIDILRDSSWNRELETTPGATIFHTAEWARVLFDCYGHTPYYYKREGNNGAVILCLAEINSALTGRRAASLPFADECRILESGRAGSNLEEVIRFAADFGREKRWKSIEIRGVPREFSELASFYGHELELTKETDGLFQKCESSVRRAVRKAEKSGITVSFESGKNAIETYFRLHCLTRKKHGVPPQPFKFFEEIHRHIIEAGLGFIALARMEGRVLAGAVFFHFAGRAVYKFGASDPARDFLRPSNLVMWSAIQRLASEGFRSLSFGRSSLHQDGLRRYKLGWGATEKSIHYLKIQIGRNDHKMSSVAPEAGSFGLLRYLPLPVLKQIGAWAYPHLG